MTHPDPLAKELEGQAAKFREQIGRYGNLTMPQTFNRLDELTAEIARLQSELAALKKPVEEGEIAHKAKREGEILKNSPPPNPRSPI